ncbi:MAG: RNA polymerase sigma factor [Anaerolineae bacterium]
MKRNNEEWLRDLRVSGPTYDAAVNDLWEYLFRVVCAYLCRHRSDLQHYDRGELQQWAEDMAQDALLKVLDKLETFRGDSRFTTWAYHIAINVANTNLRRRHWQDVSLDAALDPDAETFTRGWLIENPSAVDPEYTLEQQRLWATLRQTMQEVLTERQRFVLINALFRQVPGKVIAESLEINPNNVYKITHDARIKLRDALIEQGVTKEYVAQVFTEGRVELEAFNAPALEKEVA